MNIEQAINVCDRITYKPSWKLEARQMKFDSGTAILKVRVSFMSPCAVTGKSEIQVCATHTFHDVELDYMDVRSWCNKLLWVFRQAEEHELREFFKLDGVAIYDPHKGET
jgi:hypothetical protein